MQRIPVALALLAASASAQDYVFPLGFSSTVGPPNDSVPVARVKDQNFDGVATGPNEIFAYMTSAFPDGNNRTFLRDGEAVIENGEYTFYFGDTETGDVIRGRDDNHNGFLDAGEISEFFTFGRAQNGTGFLGSPEAIAAWNDPTTGRTVVYSSLQNSQPSFLGFTHGIYRHEDLNGDGDAKDPGETSIFVDSTMGLTVQGNTGPVTLTRDFWDTLTCLPGGKLIAWADGVTLIGPPYTVQPEMNAFYGFSDNGPGQPATAELWFNCSTLNDLPLHPDFANGTFPGMDVQETGGTDRANFVRFLDVAPPIAPGAPASYFITSSYNGPSFDANFSGQIVSGLIYKVSDNNNNQVIDAGELTLFANISGQTYAGVAPVTFQPIGGGVPVVSFGTAERPWGFDVSPDGAVSFLLSKNLGSVLTMKDDNFSGVIEQSEIAIDYETGSFGTSYPFSTFSGGPFWDGFIAFDDGDLPGPFPAGITTLGDGCLTPSRGLLPVMDAWNGAPQVGNGQLRLGPIRALPFSPAILVVDFTQAPAPLPVPGLPAGCASLLANPQSVGFTFADGAGRAPFLVPLPNNPVLAGLTVFFQGAVQDPMTMAPLPFHTTNALQVTIQP